MYPSSLDEQGQTFLQLIERFPRLLRSQEVLKQFGLTKTQALILYDLNRNGNQKATDLARFVGLTAGAITQVCDELEHMELIQRVRCKDDRRVVFISIMENGRKMLDDVMRVRSIRIVQLLERLGPEDSSELIRILGRVIDMFEHDIKE